jgi:CRISPR-associated RAMP protein (TIGR02581 family)
MEQTMIDFARFHSRLWMRGRLRLDTPLRIGSGGMSSATETDLPVVKDIAQRPYIPGSSFKGAFRAHLEAILRALDPTLACDSIAKQPNVPVAGCLTMDEVAEKKQKIEDAKALSQELIAKSCWACRVFGSQWLASKVAFKDMRVVEETWFGRYLERSGVAIDRDTETAGEGLLYALEAVPTNVEFAFEMMVENADDAEQGLVLLGIREVERGQMLLGGARSRGLGWVTLSVDEISRVDRDSLRRYLATGKAETLTDATRQTLVNTFLERVGGKDA